MMEAVLGGELYAQMKRVEKFKPSQAQFYAAQVAAVFAHLHSRDIIFRDLKPENLLIASDGYLKMVDFGLGKIFDRQKNKQKGLIASIELLFYFFDFLF